jgi:hypothetical protein
LYSTPLPHSLQGTFGPTIASLVNSYNTEGASSDALTAAQNELNTVKSIMVQNVESILSRGERIELLVDKTDNMASQATAFRRGARSVRRKMWWRNTKMVALSGVVGIVSDSFGMYANNVSVAHGNFGAGTLVHLARADLRSGTKPLRRWLLVHGTLM